MKKIGILTYLREYANIGTNMQAYCTLWALQRAFPHDRVELIDYAGWRPIPKPYLSDATMDSLKSDARRIAKYRRFFRQELVFSNQRLISSRRDRALEFIAAQGYDAIYVGSDTVLEQRGAAKDAPTAFWLSPDLAAKKFLIAASAHNLTFEALSKDQRRKIQASLDDFTLLGVRDEATHRVMSHFVGDGDPRLQLVPDPTFSFRIDYGPANRYLQQRGIVFDRPVVCLHVLRDTPWAADLAARFREAGYLVASLRPARFADLTFSDLCPFEQVGLYRFFDLVVTHRFHDTVFSLRNGTPVIPFVEFRKDVTTYGESRLHSLFRSFGLEAPSLLRNGKLTADFLYGVHGDVVAAFRERRDSIERTIDQHRQRYAAFVAQSVAALG